MPWVGDRRSLLITVPLVVGLGAGAGAAVWRAPGGSPEAEASPGLRVAPVLQAPGALRESQSDEQEPDERKLKELLARATELRQKLELYALTPVQRRIYAALEGGYRERGALIAAVAELDMETIRALEALAESEPGAYERGLLRYVLLAGSGDARWLDALLEARPAAGAEQVRWFEDESYWRVLSLALNDARVSQEARARIFGLVSSRAAEEVVASLWRLDAWGEHYGVEALPDPDTYYGLIGTLRDAALGDRMPPAVPLGKLPIFSWDAYVVTLATALADPALSTGSRADLGSRHARLEDLLSESRPDLARTLPGGADAGDWRRWIEANRALVDVWMAVGSSR